MLKQIFYSLFTWHRAVNLMAIICQALRRGRMQKNISESTALTEPRLKNQKKPKTKKLSKQLESINDVAIRAFSIRHADGNLTTFDILDVVNDLQRSMLAIGRTSENQNQDLVHRICTQVIEGMLEYMSGSDIIDVDDVHIQVEMVLRLEHQSELAEAYLKLNLTTE